jgi:hypothetical protein
MRQIRRRMRHPSTCRWKFGVPVFVIRNNKGRAFESDMRFCTCPSSISSTSSSSSHFKGRQFLLEEGTDQRYGARHLKRASERFLVGPLAKLLATEQVRSGDVLIVDRHPGEKGLAFLRDTELPSASARMPHAAAHLTHLATAEV